MKFQGDGRGTRSSGPAVALHIRTLKKEKVPLYEERGPGRLEGRKIMILSWLRGKKIKKKKRHTDYSVSGGGGILISRDSKCRTAVQE